MADYAKEKLMPTLTKGLVALAQARPADPVAWLGEDTPREQHALLRTQLGAPLEHLSRRGVKGRCEGAVCRRGEKEGVVVKEGV